MAIEDHLLNSSFQIKSSSPYRFWSNPKCYTRSYTRSTDTFLIIWENQRDVERSQLSTSPNPIQIIKGACLQQRYVFCKHILFNQESQWRNHIGNSFFHPAILVHNIWERNNFPKVRKRNHFRLYPVTPKYISNIEEEIMWYINRISRKKKQIEFLQDDIKSKNIEDMLGKPSVQQRIQRLLKKIEALDYFKE